MFGRKKEELASLTADELDDDALHQLIGQLLVVGFEGNDEQPPQAVADALSAGQVGGVILFRRNIQSVEQVAALNARIHELAAGAVATPFVAVDQEGGRVVRLKEPLTPIPPMRALGDLNDARLIADVSEVIATEIGALGFNLNFAPVLDVDSNPLNPIIGDRAFSDNQWTVARVAGAFLLGHHIAGVIPCGKHFPGHGDTEVDSHEDLPVVHHNLARLKQVELSPFERMVLADIPMLMTAHLMVPALDKDHPSTLSRRTIRELLRGEMEYKGVVITDDLEMRAVADRYQIEEMVELGLRAGVDIFLICRTEALWQRAHAHLFELARQNFDDLVRVQRAAERVIQLKRNMLGNHTRPWRPLPGWREVLGCDAHHAVMARVAETNALNAAGEASESDESAAHDPTERD